MKTIKELNINLTKYSGLEINEDWTRESLPGSVRYFDLWIEVCLKEETTLKQKSFLNNTQKGA